MPIGCELKNQFGPVCLLTKLCWHQSQHWNAGHRLFLKIERRAIEHAKRGLAVEPDPS